MSLSLVEELKARQEKEGLNDFRFGGKLGISQQLWQLYRTGKRQIPRPIVLKGVADEYPELLPEVLLFLGFNVAKGATPVVIPNALETTPDGSTGDFRRRVREFLARIFSSNRDKPAKSKSSL